MLLKDGRTSVFAPRDRLHMFMENTIVRAGFRPPLKGPLLTVGDTNSGGPSGTYYMCYRLQRELGRVISDPSPLGATASGFKHIEVNGKNINVTVQEAALDPYDNWELIVMDAQEGLFHVVALIPATTGTYEYSLDNLTLQTRPVVFVQTGFSMGVLDNHMPPSCNYAATWNGHIWMAGQTNITLDSDNAGTFRIVNQWFDRDPMDEGGFVSVGQDVTLTTQPLFGGDDDDDPVYYQRSATLQEDGTWHWYLDNGGNSYTFRLFTAPNKCGIAVDDVLSIRSLDGELIEVNTEGMTVTAVDNGEKTMTATAGGALVASATDNDTWLHASFDVAAYIFHISDNPAQSGIEVGDTVNLLNSSLAPIEDNAEGMVVTLTDDDTFGRNDGPTPCLRVTTNGELTTETDSESLADAGISKPPEPPERQIRAVLTSTPPDPDGYFNDSEVYKGVEIDDSDLVLTVDLRLDRRRLRLAEQYQDPRTALSLALEDRSGYYTDNGDGTYDFNVTDDPALSGIEVGTVLDIATIVRTRPVAVEQACVAAEVTAVDDTEDAETVTVELLGGALLETANDAEGWDGAGLLIAESAMTGKLFGKPWIWSTRLDADGRNDEAVPPLNFEFPAPLRGHMPNGLAVAGGALVVFTESEIAVARGGPGLGRPLVAWDDKALPVGLAAPRSLATVAKEMGMVGRGDLIFVGSGGRLMRYSAGAVYDEGKRLGVEAMLASVTATSWTNVKGHWDANFGWYVLSNFDPSGDAGNLSYRFVWDVQHDAFFLMKDVPTTAMGTVQDRNGNPQAVFGDDRGYAGIDNLDGVVNRDVLLESDRQGGTDTVNMSAFFVEADTIAVDGFTLATGTPFATDGDGLKGAYVHHRVVDEDGGAEGNIYTHRILSNTANSITLDANWTAGSKPTPVTGDIWFVGALHVKWVSGVVGGDDFGDKQLRDFSVRIAGPSDGLFNMRFSFWRSDGERDAATILTETPTNTRTDSWWDKTMANGRGEFLVGGVAADFVFEIEGVLQDDDLILTALQIGLDIIEGELGE